MLRSKNLKLGFIAFSTISLTYTGSCIPSQCRENHVSAILSRATFSNLCCRTRGGAFVQLRVLLRLSLPAVGRGLPCASLPDSSPSTVSLVFESGLRSVDDFECSSLGVSRCARILAGVLSAYGRDSSSIVLPRGLDVGEVIDKLRRDIP